MSLLFLALELLAVLTALLASRLPGGSGPGDLADAQVDARRRVGSALDALGGLGIPAGSCVWHVVGLQRSIREWALRQGWGGRPVRVEQAQGCAPVVSASRDVVHRPPAWQRGRDVLAIPGNLRQATPSMIVWAIFVMGNGDTDESETRVLWR